MAGCMITFNGNGGTVKGDSVISTTTGYFNLANVETRTGYDFVGWSLYQDRYVEFKTDYQPISEDLELYAWWNAIEYMVRFYDEDGNLYNVQYVTYGNTVNESNAIHSTKIGYDFVEWCTDEELTTPFSFSTKITSNIDLYPKYTLTLSKVTFYDKLNVIKLTEVEVEYGVAVGTPTIPEVKGFTYMGCYDDYDFTVPYDFTTPIYDDKIIYIYMKPIQCEVSFDDEDGNPIINGILVDYGEVAYAPINPTKKGYTFKYWMYYGHKFDFTTRIYQDITLVAKFEINTYNITYRYTDYEGNVIDHVEQVTYNELAPEYELPTIPGRTFQWWNNLDSDNEEYKHDFTVPVDSDLILYAVWLYEKIQVTYYRYDTKDLIIETMVDYGSHASSMIEPPEKEYFSFTHWVTEDGELFDFSQPITESVGIYADYKNDTTSIRFQTYDGKLVMPNQINDTDISSDERIEYSNNLACTVLLGKPFTTSTNENMIPSVTKTGYIFEAWYTDSKLTEKYDFNSIIIEPLILYAKLSKNIYTVTIRCMDNSNTYLTQLVLFGEKAIEPTTPVKSGYVFKKWVDGNGNDFSFNYAIIADTEITAEYIQIGTSDPAIMFLSMINTDVYFTGADINAGIDGLCSCTITEIREAAVIVPMNLENVLAIYEWANGMSFDTSKSYKLVFDDSTNIMSYVEKENIYNVPLSVTQLTHIINNLCGISTASVSSSDIVDYLTNFSEKFPLSEG